MKLDGFMMHGIASVEIITGNHVERVVGVTRVYQWSSGALTIYRDDMPWQWIPPHRVHAVNGKEMG